VGYDSPNRELYQIMAADYSRLLRGKTLIQLLIKYLSHKDRHTKHSRASLLEAAAVRGGKCMKQVYSALNRIFGVERPGIV
jgi:hypothetical protein